MYNHHIKISFFFFSIIAFSLLVSSCKKDEGTESELITKVSIRLTSSSPAFDMTFSATDADGDGVFNSIDPIVLPAGVTLTGTVEVLDETKNPVSDVTAEIKEENKEHLLVYEEALAGLSITVSDTDDDGAPLGLSTLWVTDAAGSGTVTMRLLHEPSDKFAADPGGEVDFEVQFAVTIQ
jgi:hypothetical protein